MLSKIPLSKLSSFPKLFTDYISRKEELKSFYGEFPDLNGFKSQIEKKDFKHREVLVNVLKQQYADFDKLPDNILALSQPNTFCVTTGHQLNIFTGPMYVIYKIISTINLAKALKEAFPDKNFVPVFWMATEDHDLAEINHFYLFNQKLVWDSAQTGAVGRMNPSSIYEIVSGLKESFPVFEKAYSNQKTLADAVRQYLHDLFGNDGLVCIDGDNKELKTLFNSVVLDDIKNVSAEKYVSEKSNELEKLGYKPQLNARNVNLFYIENDIRERIDVKEGKFEVTNTNISYTKEEILERTIMEPDKFSPNVVLRPLYQETILPNLAYLGGPAEVAYWLQLKGLFDYNEITFPIIMPRNFGLIINNGQKTKLNKLNILPEALFEDNIILKRNYVEANSSHTLNLKSEIEKISISFDEIITKGVSVDAGLKDVISAEKAKIIKNVEHLEKKIQKAEEKKHENSILQLLNIKEKLFPNGGLQERHDNFLNFYINKPDLLELLLKSLNPLDFRFNLIEI